MVIFLHVLVNCVYPFYIRCKMGNVRFRFGGRLRGLKSKLQYLNDIKDTKIFLCF